MNLQSIIIKTAYQCKPILFRVFPVSWLRKVKKQMISDNFKRIYKVHPEPYQKGKYPDGVNLIGSIRAETGLGQSCRLLANELKHGRYPISVYNYTQVGNLRQEDISWDKEISEECRYSINVIHINPHELGIALMQLDRRIWNGRYNIGFWLWEMEEFPEEWLPCLSCMDEIWTPSEFISNAIRKKTEKPVITIPYAIETEIDPVYGRKEFHLPEEPFLFLMMYDNNSICERKNPKGVIAAFQRAFTKEEKEVGLVIKMNSMNKKELEQLKFQSEGYESIYFITETFEKKKVNSLIACVDAVVSLHRAEGFGLVLAEAMFLGTPTIATNWSSNTEFMNDSVACMVDYKLIELEKDLGPFKKGQRWADADIEQAAGFMRRLYEDKEYYNRIAENAKKHIRKKLGMEQAVEKIQSRMKEILKE